MSPRPGSRGETSLQAYIHALPKAEIHLHLEGSVGPRRFLALSRKYETEYRELSPAKLKETLFQYKDFWDFLGTYKVVCQHLREPQDYVDLVQDLSEYLTRQNIRYAEVFLAPSVPEKLGFDAAGIVKASLEQGIEIGRDGGPQLRWIFDCVRQFGPEAARRTAELAVEYADRGVVGLGLAGDETSLPAEQFEEVFAWARAYALYVHVHAGEIGDPSHVWDAIRLLGANRIGHGIQAARDQELMQYLKEHAIALDVCLTSNARTGAWSPISQNPFWLLFKRGVPVTLSTDDPGLFDTDLEQEYLTASRSFDLDRSDLGYISIQGVRSSFLPHDERMKLMQDFQDRIHRLNQTHRPADP